jgi:hypothetical protein
VRPAVELTSGHHPVACTAQPEEDRRGGPHARRESLGPGRAFEIGYRGLQLVRRGVRPARVDVTRTYLFLRSLREILGALERESGRGV